MIEYNQSEHTEDVTKDLTFKVIGVGGSGANVLDRLALEGSDDAQLLVLNTDIRKLSSSVSSQKVQLGAALLKGMGTGGDPDLGRQAAVEASEEIRNAIRGYDIVFVCVGLGGGTGSGAAPEVCRIAKEEGVFLVTYNTLPFEFEGARRMEQARKALSLIESYANAVVTFENDRMGELIVPKDGVTQAFAAADKIISQSIRATMNIVSKPGIIRIGMDDLLRALENQQSRCLFGYGQAKGDNRALEAVEQTLKCPLLDNGKLLNEASNVLIQVSGSESMTLLEVQTVMKELTSHLSPNAHVLFGTGTDERLGSSLAVTIVSSLRAANAVASQPIETTTQPEPAAAQPAQVAQPAQPAQPVVTQSPLAAAVNAATKAAAAEHSQQQLAQAQPQPQVAAEQSKIVPMVTEQPVTPFEQEVIHEPITNPIANAVQEANLAAREHPVELPPVAEQPLQQMIPTAAPEPVVNRDLAPAPAPAVEEPAPIVQEPAPAIQEPASVREPAPVIQEPAPAVQEEPTPAPIDPTPLQPPVEVASAEQEQAIALSKIVPGQTTQRILNRPDQVPPVEDQVVELPEAEPEPQDILQIDQTGDTGRFAVTDPTLVDGEDLDVPTFLRKKG